jgi:hypothetical protein
MLDFSNSTLISGKVIADYDFTLNSSNLSVVYPVSKACEFTLFYNVTSLTDSTVNLFIEGSNNNIYNTLFDNALSRLITSTGIDSVMDEKTNINFLRIKLVGNAIIDCELKVRLYSS